MKFLLKLILKLYKGVISISCFWSHRKILFLAEIIAGQRSALMCNCIAQAIRNRALKIES